jgi:hypothetical protein
MTIVLRQNERDALIDLSQRLRRDPRAQAALLIRDGLEQAGLLPADVTQPAQTPRVDDFNRVVGVQCGE